MLNVLKVRIYSTKEQDWSLAKNFGCVRFVGNYYFKFKSRNKKQSIRYPESCSIRNKGIKLPKLGIVKAKISQGINGKINSVTVSKTSTDKYFAAILLEMDDLITIEKLKISGIDLGLSSLVTVKVNEKMANTRQDFLRKLSRKLCDKNQIVVAENLNIKGLALSTNTDGQSEFQAWVETVRLVGTCTQKRVSVDQESPVTAPA